MPEAETTTAPNITDESAKDIAGFTPEDYERHQIKTEVRKRVNRLFGLAQLYLQDNHPYYNEEIKELFQNYLKHFSSDSEEEVSKPQNPLYYELHYIRFLTDYLERYELNLKIIDLDGVSIIVPKHYKEAMSSYIETIQETVCNFRSLINEVSPNTNNDIPRTVIFVGDHLDLNGNENLNYEGFTISNFPAEIPTTIGGIPVMLNIESPTEELFKRAAISHELTHSLLRLWIMKNYGTLAIDTNLNEAFAIPINYQEPIRVLNYSLEEEIQLYIEEHNIDLDPRNFFRTLNTICKDLYNDNPPISFFNIASLVLYKAYLEKLGQKAIFEEIIEECEELKEFKKDEGYCVLPTNQIWDPKRMRLIENVIDGHNVHIPILKKKLIWNEELGPMGVFE